MEFAINYFAVGASAIAAMALGALWYSPILFGKPWMAMMGITPGDMDEAKKKKMIVAYAGNFLMAIITAYILAHFITLAGMNGWTGMGGALTIATLLWFGFTMTAQTASVFWEGKPVLLFVLNTGYGLASLLISGVILTLWV